MKAEYQEALNVLHKALEGVNTLAEEQEEFNELLTSINIFPRSVDDIASDLKLFMDQEARKPLKLGKNMIIVNIKE